MRTMNDMPATQPCEFFEGAACLIVGTADARRWLIALQEKRP